MDRFHFESHLSQASEWRSATSDVRSFVRSRKNWTMVLTTFLLLGTSSFTGCRRAAYNEYYVENMAGEIRALEDRIYEYDSAYTALEVENDDLRKAIADLRSKNYAPAPESWGSDSPEIRLVPRNQRSSKANSGGIEVGPSDLEEIDLSPKTAKPGNKSLLLEEVPPEAISKPPAAMPKGTRVEPAPVVPLLPDTTEGDESQSQGDELPPPATLPSFPNSNNSPADGSKKGGKLPGDKELDLDFEMPTGTKPSAGKPFGSTQPGGNKKNANTQRVVNLPDMSDDSIAEGKVALPLDPNVVPASAQIPVTANSKTAKPKDAKLVEIGFHPTLSRGHNFDDRPGDDGLYLVLTPLNGSGEVLNDTGNLTIVVEETKEDMSRRIAAWEVTPEELQDSLEPIGASQGFHLSLPWDDIVPEGNQVQVFLKYSLPDGRTLVNRKDFKLRKPGARQTAWTPR